MNLKSLFKRNQLNNKRVESKSSQQMEGLGETSEHKIRELFKDCQDIHIQKFFFGEREKAGSILLIYCDGLCETELINQMVLPKLEKLYDKTKFASQTMIEKWRNMSIFPLDVHDCIDPLFGEVFAGNLLIYFIEAKAIYTIDIANPPRRKPEESNTEVSVRGPRDGFVEDITINVALIRKRLKSPSLAYEQFIIGKRSHTRIGLIYFSDIANKDTIAEVRERIDHLNLDGLQDSNHLQDIITDGTYSIFPTLDFTGRPDYAVECLLKGRFILVVDGSPTVLIGPSNLFLLMKTPEDLNSPFFYVAFARFLRLIGFLISLFLPGFYIALISYHQDQIPVPLLATIAMSRTGVPMSAPLELIIIIGLYELFREAGVRLPKPVGQTLTVVGGLIIGDAAIRSGVGSPMIILVASLTAVARYTLVSQTLNGAVSVLSLAVIIASMTFGLFGFFIMLLAIVLLMSNVESFGTSFLTTISPLSPRELIKAIFAVPWRAKKYRPSYLNIKDPTRLGDKKP